MNHFTRCFFLVWMIIPVLATSQPIIPIIPKPLTINVQSGYFTIDHLASFQYDTSNKDLHEVVALFNNTIKQLSGIDLLKNSSKSKTINISLVNNPLLGAEEYELLVTQKNIFVKASSRAGIFYALQSVLHTLPSIRTNAILAVPAMKIKDAPRFKWRGMHLDVSRHFFSPELVKQYIDLMSKYKMNVFHWHLVDDQGWRIEIKKYPKLTQIGAWRVDKNDQIWNDRPQATENEAATYGGYYTVEQIKEIIEYARQRSITVVPEIEMPGHVASAIVAYPFLSCEKRNQLPLTGGNYKGTSSNYCAGDENVYSFLQDVLTEVIDLFPSTYIHIGGDEVDKTNWKKCASCQAKIKAEKLASVDELQSYFITRIEKFLLSKNRKMIGWDEILEGGLAPNATVMSWRGETGGIQAAQMNHDVIMTPGTPCYFDHYQAEPSTEPIAIGGFNTLKKVYNYEPIPQELNEQNAKYVLGAQANLWTEYVTTPAHVIYMILPRMLALSEVVWSSKENKNWDHFNTRLQSHFKAFDALSLPHCKGNFKTEIEPLIKNDSLFVTLSTEAFLGECYYTTDGSTPTLLSKKYADKINITKTSTIKAITVVNGKIMSTRPTEQAFVVHQAILRNVVYTHPVSQSYPANGPNSLTDGIRGTEKINAFWHGISSKDLIATVDLGQEKVIHQVTVGFLQDYKNWIFMPTSMNIEISNDGKHFTNVGAITNTFSVQEKAFTINDFVVEFDQKKARYVRVSAKNLGICPKGHNGEGMSCWLFADEIIVK